MFLLGDRIEIQGRDSELFRAVKGILVAGGTADSRGHKHARWLLPTDEINVARVSGILHAIADVLAK